MPCFKDYSPTHLNEDATKGMHRLKLKIAIYHVQDELLLVCEVIIRDINSYCPASQEWHWRHVLFTH